jgi:putative salt-induced outer membrane protein
MKKSILSIIAFAISVSFTFAQTAQDVLDKYIEATGGKSLWDGVNTYSMKQSYKSGAATDYDMEVKAVFGDGSMSKAKTILKRTFIYGIKGNEGWLKVPLGSSDKAAQYETKDLSQKEQENMRRELREIVLPFWDFQKKGYVATLVGSETLNGKKVNHVELSGKGIKYNLYFDEATGLMTRRKLTLASGEVITEDYTNYATSPYGIKYPSESTYTSTADKRTVKVTTSIVFNDNISASSIAR